MSEASVMQLHKQIARKRNELHAVVNGNFSLLLDERTYHISTELDELIVKLMKKELKERQINTI
ncbi:MAG: Spo0E family sporulation regulatory protein-aspartic acid phosphatase [Clostridia bacterium]|nr:Spo0E family sporulation regulatory protein-aspartic acid phosphatase [Clostridia bacterium]